MVQNNLLTNDCEQAHFLSVTNVTSLTSIHEAHHQPLASLWVTAIFGILGMMFLGTSRSSSSWIWELQYHHEMYRSLHGGLSHDGREDESYPLQPYYWLAIDLPCTRKYDHLDEEQAWHRDCSMKGTLKIMYCVEIQIVQNIREAVKNYLADFFR